MSKVDIYFVRHGSTEYNKGKIIQGQTDRSSLAGVGDRELLLSGYEQANALVNLVKANGFKPQVVVSSPLKRASQTAEAMAGELGLAHLENEAFRELFFGAENEGVPVEDFKKIEFNPVLEFEDAVDGSTYTVANGKELRELHKGTNPRHDLLSHPGGETKKEVMERAKKGIVDFCREHPEYTEILIPTHNALLRFVMSSICREANCETVGHEEIVYITYDTETGLFEFKNRITA